MIQAVLSENRTFFPESTNRKTPFQRGTKIFSALVFSLWAFFAARPLYASTSVTFPESWDLGQAFVVALSSHRPFENPSVTWQGRVISLDVEPGREGYVSYALLGAHVRDVKAGNHPLNFDFTQDNRLFRVKCSIALKNRKYPEEELKVANKMINPPKSELERIKQESRLTAAARRTMTAKRLWTTPPTRPVPGVFTSRYGYRRIYNGVPGGYHGGTDFRAAVGTQIRAPFAGTVVLTGDHYYAGKSVYIDSGNGVISLFFHMSEIDVKKGDFIEKGQIIGKTGATGRITGPHLHYGLSLGGQYVDAAPLFSTSVTALLKEMKTEVVRP
ncbi:MAG: M23 family metallopeptidase [Synergistaceae bacterium]|jgi:murein DD-endopeptidase MepM/ murein hydrolase activator NlpD|nr:M23 family metallopeptidase [Synergistaceae bacterium]